jgi:pimeloyl-ACP methyl ester carboxylesterase
MRSTTTLAFSDSGTGEPALLYLPGWCGGREVFSPLLARTAETRRSVSVDWRGHGESPSTGVDFGTDELIEDAIELIDNLQLDRVVPVALSHAGWVALELRRKLGAERIPAVVLLDWMPLGTPPGFAEALQALQDPEEWSATRAQLFGLWSAGVDRPDVLQYIESMSAYGFPHVVPCRPGDPPVVRRPAHAARRIRRTRGKRLTMPDGASVRATAR